MALYFTSSQSFQGDVSVFSENENENEMKIIACLSLKRPILDF